MASALEMDAVTRRQITRTMIDNIKKPETPPEGFNHLKATNTELLKYGLPPRPDKTQYPKLAALWESMLSRPLTVVFPEFKINDTVHHPQNANPQNGSGGNAQNSIWSGAVINTPPAGETFYTITGAWIVPNAYPPPSASVGNGKFTPGTYQSWTWVGLDGWNTPAVLQGGTQSICTVGSNGSISSHTAAFWIEWYPSSEITLSLAVSPGDMVQCVVCGQSTTEGTITLINTSAGTSTPSIPLSNPSSKQGVPLPLLGATAEWVMEDPSNATTLVPLPFANYGSTFFFNTICASKNSSGNGQESNLSNAFLLDMAQGGTVMATTVEENSEVFLSYAYGDTTSTIP
jgi:hypothetical protein